METKHICDTHCVTLASLHLIRDKARQNAYKYRRDPFVRGIHEQYEEYISCVLDASSTNHVLKDEKGMYV